MSSEKTLQPWAEEAFDFFRRCFPLIDLKTTYIDDNLWHMTYVLLFGMSELCEHFDTRIELRIICNETNYQPNLRCLDPDLTRCLVELAHALLDDPDRMSPEILECRLHPEPGTTPPDHEARIETLEMIRRGDKVVLDGSCGTPELLDRLIYQLRSGRIGVDEIEQFDPELLDVLRQRMEQQISEISNQLDQIGGEPDCRSPHDKKRWAAYWHHAPAGNGQIN
jgi:hypothetical protein